MGKHFEQLGDYGLCLLSRRPSQNRLPLLGKPLSIGTANDVIPHSCNFLSETIE